MTTATFADLDLFAGASTIPEARNQDAQQTILKSRFRFAVDQG